MEPQHVFTVSELNTAARTTLEQEFGQIWVQGEISNLTRAPSGHLYFTLKD
ncbi:exodeoxyribonuclease VII large subunit, partial [Candidatus Bipolaricaulota bacterium]|nr:exodeoxyribonuclease VII large subunit [Candidatus Bipolaricaulota bacterium]